MNKLELASNQMGPKCLISFAESLAINKSLILLNLESNEITLNGQNIQGIQALGYMMKYNKTLQTLNLWRCNIGPDGGRLLADALALNDTILFMDIGHNNILMKDQVKIRKKLEENMARHTRIKEDLEMEKRLQERREAERQAIEDQIRKERELKQWLEDEKRKRATKRREQKEAEYLKEKEDERERHIEEMARLQAEKEALEAAAKKGKKKKKK